MRRLAVTNVGGEGRRLLAAEDMGSAQTRRKSRGRTALTLLRPGRISSKELPGRSRNAVKLVSHIAGGGTSLAAVPAEPNHIRLCFALGASAGRVFQASPIHRRTP
jgi:hypothetical protein